MCADPIMYRRDLFLYPAGALLLATGVASCTPSTDPSGLEKALADVITKIQAAVKGACSLVPTATTVVEVLLAFVGTTNPTVAALAALAQQAIDYIAKACPAPAGTLKGAPESINGKTPPIVFY